MKMESGVIFMELDTKQKVLLALYTEYQKDLPDMKAVSAEELGINREVFIVALDKLVNEGLITGVNFTKGGRSPHPLNAYVDGCKLTPYGLDYVERKLQIEPTLSGADKAKNVAKKLAEWGWEQGKDFAAKIAAELLKGATGSSGN
jgi:predicted ArsR family transcriptional regulator